LALRPLVLVVDDQPLARSVRAAVLAKAGYRILEAASADEALIMLERHPSIEMLVTAVNMPGSMDGLELARRIGEDWPGIGTIVVWATITA
jgi:two-component system, response regulator PdtaR